MQRFSPDYGLDLLVTTFNRRGEIENGDVRLQIKATDSVKTVAEPRALTVRLEWRDVVYWLTEPMPVILVVYDARADRACWLDLQAALRLEARTLTAARLTVRVPLDNELNAAAVRSFRTLRDAALARNRGRSS